MPLVNCEPAPAMNLHKMFREMVFNLDFQHSITTGDISAASPSQNMDCPWIYRNIFESASNKLYPNNPDAKKQIETATEKLKITENKQGQLNLLSEFLAS